MTTTPCLVKTTTFYQLLEQTPGLDERDNPGKRHTTALILTGLVLALCCGRDGNLSSLHRHMVNHFEPLCDAIQQNHKKPISRAQLPLLLARVNGPLFAKLLFEWLGWKLNPDQKRWFALDGKELRGSIPAGHTRGEVCVSALAHQTEEVVGQAYYTGTKESERPTVGQLLADRGLYGQKLTLDALHLIPLTIKLIHKEAGCYVVGLKANQAYLHRHCVCLSLFNQANYERFDIAQTKHGRKEQRSYRCFSISPLALDSRWTDAGLATLLWVKRRRQVGSVLTEVISYFVSNSEPTSQEEADELFDAIRQHWRIEVMHHKRDVSLAEDALRTGKQAVSRLLSSLRTLIITLLKEKRTGNMVAQLEGFADKFQTLIQFLTQQMVL